MKKNSKRTMIVIEMLVFLLIVSVFLVLLLVIYRT